MASGTTLHYFDRTDIGRRRSNNQDSKAVLEPWNRELYKRRGWLFVVADGMGAHAAGERASAIAAEQVPLIYEKLANRSPALALRMAIEQANAEIHARGESAADLKGMGTTCTVLVIVPRGALVGHVGDSRAYRVRAGRIEQLSRDHSLAWELQAMHDTGQIDPAIDPRETPKNIITRSMGPHPQVQVDMEGPFPVEAGDVYVLCSDGLSGQVADEEIGLFAGSLAPREAAAALLGLALVRGAPDNVTVIVARAGEKEVSKASPADPPWPLTDEPASTARPPIPWRMLAATAASLFLALVAYGRYVNLGPDDANGLAGAVLLAVAGFAVLAFLTTLLFAFLGFLAPADPGRRMLPVGTRLGEGPYRNHDCRPRAALVEGVVASVETAAEGTEGSVRHRAEEASRRARTLAAAGDHDAAIAAAAAAIAAYAEAVEAARAGATRHG
ncbi:MAG: PP2C family protein-serine/threonine phosphatase [Planctomycetia bacterium]